MPVIVPNDGEDRLPSELYDEVEASDVTEEEEEFPWLTDEEYESFAKFLGFEE